MISCFIVIPFICGLFCVHCTRADKEAKREGKQLIKQLERNKREAEKETYRLDEEHKQEKWQSVSPSFSTLLLFVLLSNCCNL